MKFQILSVAVAGLALAACSGGDSEAADSVAGETAAENTATETDTDPETEDVSSLRADCDILATDPEALESFAEIGTDADSFCACFVQVIEASPEEEREPMKATLEEVTDGMQASGEGAEDIVSRIMSETLMNPDSETSQASQFGVRLIGGVIDDVSDSLEDTGSCPAA